MRERFKIPPKPIPGGNIVTIYINIFVTFEQNMILSTIFQTHFPLQGELRRRVGEPFSETELSSTVSQPDSESDRIPENGKRDEWAIHSRGGARTLGFPMCRENVAVPKCGAWQVTMQDIL